MSFVQVDGVGCLQWWNTRLNKYDNYKFRYKKLEFFFQIKDIHFPPCVFKKLTASYTKNEEKNNLEETVGVVPTLNLFDLKYIMPGLAASLQNLLEYEGDVLQDFMMTFEVSYNEFDVIYSEFF